MGDRTPPLEKEPPIPKLSGPKRHHFLPKFYLEGFTKDGVLAVYDRESNSIRVQPPINTGVIGHFYTFEDEKGRKRFELEEALSESEGQASPIITKLSNREDISSEERSELALFVALAAFRTPDFIDSAKLLNSEIVGTQVRAMFADVEDVEARMREKPGPLNSGDKQRPNAQELVDFAQSGAYEIETDHNWAVGMAMELATAMAPIFAGRDWTVLHREIDKKSFVTTDAPVILTTVVPRRDRMWGIGFGNSDALVLFPLGESCLLTIHGDARDLTHKLVSGEQMRRANLTVTNRCQRFVIGRDESLVRSLVNRVGLATGKWRPKMQAG